MLHPKFHPRFHPPKTGGSDTSDRFDALIQGPKGAIAGINSSGVTEVTQGDYDSGNPVKKSELWIIRKIRHFTSPNHCIERDFARASYICEKLGFFENR